MMPAPRLVRIIFGTSSKISWSSLFLSDFDRDLA